MPFKLRAVLVAGVVVLGLLTLGSAPAAGQKPGKKKADPDGKPQVKGGPSFLVWRTGKGKWHVAVAGKGGPHQFFGTIAVVGGQVLEVSRFASLEPKDFGIANNKTITFNFKNKGAEDTFTFAVGPKTKQIHFNLLIDGRPQPDRIFIGAKKANPKAANFTLPAQP